MFVLTLWCVLQAGASPHVQDVNLKTPLMFAVEENHIDVVNYLIKANATVNAKVCKSYILSSLMQSLSFHDYKTVFSNALNCLFVTLFHWSKQLTKKLKCKNMFIIHLNQILVLHFITETVKFKKNLTSPTLAPQKNKN